MKQEVSPSGMTLLWTNPNPTDSMSATSITIPNMENYSLILVVFGTNISGYGNVSTLAVSGEISNVHCHYIVGNNGGCVTYVRNFTPSGNTLSVSANDNYGYDSNGRFRGSNNGILVPKYVYGVQ